MRFSQAIAFFVLAILVLSTLGLFAGESVPAEKNLKNQRIAHAPIHINGNDDFARQAQQNGWPGNGTQENPYVIEGYEIDANGGTYCIWIENTDVYFVIRDCVVFNASNLDTFPYGSGITLKKVQNGAIINNSASKNSWQGIYLYSSSYNHITNNTCWGNSWNGIYLYYSCNYNNISNNTVTSNSWSGIYLDFGSQNNIVNNRVIGNSHYGIFLLDYSNYNNITGNMVHGNSQYGIYLDSSSYNQITKNNASGNGDGIHLWRSNGNNITYNWLYQNTNYGVYIISGSTANTIHHNNFIRNNGASKGTTDGKSQAYDDAGGNSWYNSTSQEGNYWSNWDGSGWGTPHAYPIAGGVASDWYPILAPAGKISVIAMLEQTEIEGKKGNVVNATVRVVNGNTLLSGINVTLTIAPIPNIQVSPQIATTDANGTAKFTITLTSNFTQDTSVSIEPKATIEGVNYTGAPAILNITSVTYNITVALEPYLVEGIKGSMVNATVKVMHHETPLVGIKNVRLIATPDAKIQITPTTATTDANGSAKFTIVLTADFTNNTTLSIEPKATIDGIDYTGSSATLTIKGVTYNITLALEASQIEGIKGNVVNATATVVCNTTPVPGVNVTLIEIPESNIQITPAIATTDANGTAKFTIMLTADFTNDTTISIEPVATINGINYTGAAANLTIKAIGYEVSLTLAAEEIEGKKNNTVQAKVSVRANGVGIANLTITLAFDRSGLSATTAKTDENGTALLTITITEDFSQDTTVKVIPKVEGKNYPEATKNLMVKVRAETQPKTPGFEIIAFLVGLTAAFLAFKRKMKNIR